VTVGFRSDRQVAMPRPDEGIGLFQGIGMGVLVTFLFLIYSRLTDAFLANLYLPLVTSLIALLVAIGTGGVVRALTSRAGIYLVAFSVWLVLALPFSVWQGGSVQFLWNEWLKSFLVFVIVAGLPRSVKQCRAAMYSIAAGTIVIVLMCLVLGTTSQEGRLVLGQGVLANPNDLAQLLLMGVPFLLLMAMSKGRLPLRRPVATICIGGVLLVTAATGSRGALTAFACLMLVMFLNFSMGAKLRLLGGLALIAPLMIMSLSADQRQRYLTIFGGELDAEQPVDVSALESTQQRVFLLEQSIEMTVEHPLFGVGPGVFQVASAKDSEDEGQRAAWRETHNTYTEISSEAGLPALIFYLAALVTCLTSVRMVYKTALSLGMEDVANVSYCLWLSLISFATTSFFNSVAYHQYFPTLAGLSVALSLSAQAAFDGVKTKAAEAAGASPRLASLGFRSKPSASI
jgi:O-antigen ligase